MDSSTQSDRLLDLLYGECSPEDEAELREAIDDDEELADQWHQLRERHRDVTRHLPPPQEVPDDVSASILRAAADHAADTDDPSANGASTTSDGLWTSFVDSGGLRIAASLSAVAVATVVLYVYYEGDVVDPDVAPDPFSAPEIAQEADEPPPVEYAYPQQDVDDAEERAREQPAQAQLDALEVADAADSEATELAEAIEADDVADRGDTAPTGDADDAPLIMAEGTVDAESEPAPEERARAASSAPQAQPRLQDSPAAGGGASADVDRADDDLAAMDSLGRIGTGSAAGSSVDDEPEPSPPAEAQPSPPATSSLERARTAYDDGDLDRARAYLRAIDDDELDDDELEEFHKLQDSLDDD